MADNRALRIWDGRKGIGLLRRLEGYFDLEKGKNGKSGEGSERVEALT